MMNKVLSAYNLCIVSDKVINTFQIHLQHKLYFNNWIRNI